MTVGVGYGDPAASTHEFVSLPYESADVSALLARLPTRFQPDAIVLALPEFAAVPRGLAESPVPVVLWVQDFLMGTLKLAALVPLARAAASLDAHGIPALHRLGLNAFLGLANWYEQGAFEAPPDASRDIDVAFLTGFDRAHVNPTYLERDRLVLQLAPLASEARRSC